MRRTLLLALLFGSASWSAHAQDLLIRGGTIHTGVDGAAPVEAVLVRDGRIA